MKLTVTREITEELEIDIEFPAYFKRGDYCIKAFNEAQNLWIRGKDISHNYLDLDYIIGENYDKATPEEFNAALANAIRHIKNINKQK